MKAITFNITIPRYISGITIGKLFPAFLWGGQSCTVYQEVPEPELPGEDWALIRTIYGGICGSDISAIRLQASPYFSALVSSQYTLGHENTGVIGALGTDVSGWQVGDRVVVEPTLWCLPRGFTDLCPFCERGEINRCEHTSIGNLAPGLSIGNCQDTGGSWGPFFVAHKSQLYHLPESISDENALMIEPFSTSLHAVMQNFPADDKQVLILGAGTIGLCTLAALRALGSQAEIVVLARYPFQSDAAHKLGANKVISAGRNDDYYEAIQQLTGASIIKPILGKRVVIGGVDHTYECVGSRNSIDDAMRLTRGGGRVTLLGMSGIVKGMDWTSIFLNELELQGTYIFNHAEKFQGESWKTFDVAIELMSSGKVDLSWMVTHKFQLDEYKRALKMVGSRAENQVIKAVFKFDDNLPE